MTRLLRFSYFDMRLYRISIYNLLVFSWNHEFENLTSHPLFSNCVLFYDVPPDFFGPLFGQLSRLKTRVGRADPLGGANFATQWHFYIYNLLI